MNLGIEDAFVFADLLASDRLSEYSANRRAIDRQVVKQVDRLSRLTIGESATIRMIRNVFLPAALNIDFLRNAIIRGLSGLDHNVA
jgi:2-polyprenyl-6-methoxyphenol hydroxylase-like FAD-dependent oxidoreductase